MNRKWITPLFLTAVVLVPISVFAVVIWLESRYQSLPVLGPPGHTVGEFAFTDQTNSNYTGKNWNGRMVVANYFFTHCPVVCPKITTQLKRLQTAVGKEVVICSFSVDPLRDSSARLSQYAEQFGIDKGWKLLTGNKKELYRFARNELQLVVTDGDGGPDDFIHSENLVLIDGRKRIRGYYKGTDEKEVTRLIADINKLKKEPNAN